MSAAEVAAARLDGLVNAPRWTVRDADSLRAVLRLAVAQSGLSQYQIAEKMHCAQPRVSYMLTGKSALTLANVTELLAAIGSGWSITVTAPQRKEVNGG